MVNLKEVAMRKLAMDENKEALDEMKVQLRAGAKTSNKGYASLRFDDQVTYSFKPEDQQKISNFCKENCIQKIKSVIPGHKVIITPTPKAIAEYNNHHQ